MIRIAILDQNSYLLDKLDFNLHQQGFAATTALDGENLSVWLAKHGIDMLVLHLPNEEEQPATTSISRTKPELLNGNEPACWHLNPSRLELITPAGRPIPLSHNECCLLGAAANANGNLVSRKMLIEALGQDFWHYDERRLESLISRLRRKLASYAPEDFSIRGVKGQGYLFGVALQVVEI
ncbi:transcriptional regulator [Methylobacter tundripaludum]|uniref:Transcriptional regulator n=1 Tax=Methylobacter tundripaludum TaxID=173365 RepID=A0A2S6H4J0_9GAMM|nr:winged helix-turn-helix domain-containing protein [Methylobacter tundripaludum]PPK72409.1 transcriptional regulator [Methylobacter tundripaludum]